MERLTEHEELVAAQTHDLIVNAMTNSERSRWAKDHKIGVSDIGHCREFVRRVLLQEGNPGAETNAAMAAFVGTAVGDLIERTMAQEDEHVITQPSVTVRLSVGDYQLNLPGHPDLILPRGHGNEIRDIKTKNGLALISRSGPTTQQRFQLALYGRGAIDADLVDPENLTLSLVYLDRSGADGPRPEVFSWLWTEAEVAEAEDWLGDVFYAIENGEEASRDMPRSWCHQWCPLAPECRSEDSDVTGLIEDEELVLAAKVYAEAVKVESRAKRDKESARAALLGVSGHTPDYSVRTVTVPESVTPCEEDVHTRRGYSKIEVKERKARP